jgi:anti-sigma factor RsiW
MNPTCNDRDRILEDGAPVELAALETHAGTCAACAEELRAWRSLSTAAAELRDYADTPSLWPRVRQALAEHAVHPGPREKRWSWSTPWLGLGLSWQTAAVSAFALLLLVSGGWLYFGSLGKAPVADSAAFLKSKALNEVEQAEDSYVQAINKLAAEAQPQMESADSALLANYREKLLVLDSAIEDLRAQAGQNPSNAHLRYELLAMYREKQRTLEEILEARQP